MEQKGQVEIQLEKIRTVFGLNKQDRILENVEVDEVDRATSRVSLEIGRWYVENNTNVIIGGSGLVISIAGKETTKSDNIDKTVKWVRDWCKIINKQGEESGRKYGTSGHNSIHREQPKQNPIETGGKGLPAEEMC